MAPPFPQESGEGGQTRAVRPCCACQLSWLYPAWNVLLPWKTWSQRPNIIKDKTFETKQSFYSLELGFLDTCSPPFPACLSEHAWKSNMFLGTRKREGLRVTCTPGHRGQLQEDLRCSVTWPYLCSPGEPHRGKNQLLGVWDRMEPKCVRRVPATSDTAAHSGTHIRGG